MTETQVQIATPYDQIYNKIWATLGEISVSQKETEKIIDRTAKRQEKTANSLKEIRNSLKETKNSLKETAKRQKETAKRQEETSRQIEENSRQMKEYNKRFGDFTNNFGEVVEHMFVPNMCDRFKELGFIFPRSSSNMKVKDRKTDIYLEIDVFLENGDTAMLVEIKTKLTTAHVKEHIKRLEKMRIYSDSHGNKRAFLGAFAAVVAPLNIKKYALDQGFFIIEPHGDTLNITLPNGKPKKW